MKIEFLNSERTEALLTRGHLWWKERAFVSRGVARPSVMPYRWVYTLTGEDCGWDLDKRLDNKATRLAALADRERKERAWVRDSDMFPVARCLGRGKP